MEENKCNDIIIRECCQIWEHYTARYCKKRKRGVAPFQDCDDFRMRGAGKFFEVIDTTE